MFWCHLKVSRIKSEDDVQYNGYHGPWHENKQRLLSRTVPCSIQWKRNKSKLPTSNQKIYIIIYTIYLCIFMHRPRLQCLHTRNMFVQSTKQSKQNKHPSHFTPKTFNFAPKTAITTKDRCAALNENLNLLYQNSFPTRNLLHQTQLVPETT